MIIDAHQHYWNPHRGDYTWMPVDNPILYRTYLPQDLHPVLDHFGIQRTVLVPAAASIHETEYLLGLADITESIAGVVGWVDFEAPGDLLHLERLSQHPKFLGVRPMIQDIKDVDWMLREDVQWAYQALIDLDLTFDALGFPQHQPNFQALLNRYPDMRVVLDHCMKPQIRSNGFDAWASGIERLAKDTGAYVKLSGLVTEAAADWQIDDLRPYADHVLAQFGADRIMWGSDWPVCQLNAPYERWHDVAKTLTDPLSEAEKARIFGGTAIDFYGIKP